MGELKKVLAETSGIPEPTTLVATVSEGNIRYQQNLSKPVEDVRLGEQLVAYIFHNKQTHTHTPYR